MEEIWKDINGYNGLYQISNFGKVKSLNYRKSKKEKELTPKINNDGYLWVQLFGKPGKNCFLIHRLVASAFIENPNNYPVINHKDENKTNNAVTNLEWCTQRYNVLYSAGKQNRKRKLSRNKKIAQLRKSGEVIKVWDNLVSIKHETGWNDWHIEECCKGNRKTAKGYVWRYAN